jgi:hypothetical protein
VSLPFTATQGVESVGRWYQDQEKDKPNRYQVMVRDLRTKEYLVGCLVTFLSPEEYCEMHGFQLMERYKGTRPALSHERTELV